MGIPVKITAISIVRPSHGVDLHYLVTFEDGTCQRKPVHPIHALRQAAELLDGAAFILGNTKEK
jgi:hypothetical protein